MITNIGEFVNNKRHGMGKFEFNSGTIFVGEWRDDLPNGKGKIVFKNGKCLEGEWKDGENIRTFFGSKTKSLPRQMNVSVKIESHNLCRDDH
jgi:hypothetical protein